MKHQTSTKIYKTEMVNWKEGEEPKESNANEEEKMNRNEITMTKDHDSVEPVWQRATIPNTDDNGNGNRNVVSKATSLRATGRLVVGHTVPFCLYLGLVILNMWIRNKEQHTLLFPPFFKYMNHRRCMVLYCVCHIILTECDDDDSKDNDAHHSSSKWNSLLGLFMFVASVLQDIYLYTLHEQKYEDEEEKKRAEQTQQHDNKVQNKVNISSANKLRETNGAFIWFCKSTALYIMRSFCHSLLVPGVAVCGTDVVLIL